MTVLTPTKDKGATTKLVDGVLYVEPAHEMTPATLAAFAPDTGMNGDFLADFMSAMLTHERCGRHLYRSVAGRTNNPILKRKYEEFGQEIEKHAALLEELVVVAGGSPGYVSPLARAVQGMDTKLVESTFALSGSIDIMSAESAMLDAVFVAESIDHANWTTLAALTEKLPEGDLRTAFERAVQEVGAEEDEHLLWASTMRQRMVVLQASSSTMAAMGAKAEETMARVKGWFADES